MLGTFAAAQRWQLSARCRPNATTLGCTPLVAKSLPAPASFTHSLPPLPLLSPCPAWQVLLLVPTAGSRLLPLLSSNFPHKLRDRNTQCLYLRAAFALAEGRAGGAIREGVLAGVVEHLIGIDVEIRCVPGCA